MALNTDLCFGAHCLVARVEMNQLILDIREEDNQSAYSGLHSCLTILSFMLKNKYSLRFHRINYGRVSRYSSSADPF